MARRAARIEQTLAGKWMGQSAAGGLAFAGAGGQTEIEPQANSILSGAVFAESRHLLGLINGLAGSQ